MRDTKNRGWAVLAGLAALFTVLAASLAAALAFYAQAEFAKLEAGPGETFSTRLYAAPFVLTGAPVSSILLLERLSRLSYRRVGTTPGAPGEFEWAPPNLTVYLRGFKTPSLSQDSLLADFRQAAEGGAWTLRTYAGVPLQCAALEPEVAAELSGPKRVRREPATWEEIPKQLKDAVVATEDKRFYSHWGLDPRGLVRAGLADLHGRAIAGGSTITQQLAKNLFLSPQRTFKRKLLEASLAVYLELRLSKQEILTRYLNHIYLGQDGVMSVAGVKAAAHFYFSKDLSALDLSQCAFLAGAIRSPYRYNPWRDPAAARGRRDHVLGRMLEEGMISQQAMAAAALEPLRPGPRARAAEDQAAYFVAEVQRLLLPQYGEEELYGDGLAIYTTLDPILQGIAQRTVVTSAHQAALVSLDPATGDVLALAGGTDFEESQFNRATQARRQPGSSFKPFAYGAALEAGLTPMTILQDGPKQWKDASGKTWKPRNYGGVYLGTATVRQALEHSLNGATLDLASRIGPARIKAFAKRLGIESPLESDLSLALGAYEVTLLELTGAYAAFDNGGFRVTPRLITAVADAAGNTLESIPSTREQAIDPAIAYLVTSLLESVVKEGTAQGLAKLGFARPAAGKTGTTNLGADAWFVGFTPQLVTGVWVGEDVRKPLGLTGAKDALPLWAAFMKPALAGTRPEDFAASAGIVAVDIDPQTGYLAGPACPQHQTEYFLKGTQPTVTCPVHKVARVSWWKRIFGR